MFLRNGQLQLSPQGFFPVLIGEGAENIEAAIALGSRWVGFAFQGQSATFQHHA
jgi:hypothetical protein